jgi:hypothetical protein
MVKKTHKVLSLFLCLILALSAICAGTIAASAAAGDTVYVRLNNGWSQVYIYMWNSSSDTGTQWPGEKMQKSADGIYSYTYSKNFDYVIFNNGSGGNGNQTADLSYKNNGGDGKIYDLASGTWSTYTQATTKATAATTATKATTATSATTATTKPVSSSDTWVVYLDNQNGWSNPSCYAWNSSSDSNASWPGVTMTYVGDSVYKYTASKEYKNCIFSNGGSNQTTDLVAQNGGLYNNATGTWSTYDVSPLQVKSYSVDPTSGIYKGADVVVSAEAENESGATVYYSFSVTASNGSTTTLSDYSTANSATWTPSAAGTYTVNFNFKDSDGNENSRKTEVTVLDDAASVKPIIKSVSPANLNYISVGTSAVVSVKAGGGITGTNLLFYKYVVTNPDGTTNKPYYTLNSSYSFKPATNGTYKVQVYVQGSDNSTVSKTYTYTAINGSVPGTTAATIPTTTKATTPSTTKPTTTVATTTKPVVTGVEGDANRDGYLSILDASYLQCYLVELSGYTMTDETKSLCDLDKDGILTIKDATCIQKKLVDLPY